MRLTRLLALLFCLVASAAGAQGFVNPSPWNSVRGEAVARRAQRVDRRLRRRGVVPAGARVLDGEEARGPRGRAGGEAGGGAGDGVQGGRHVCEKGGEGRLRGRGLCGAERPSADAGKQQRGGEEEAVGREMMMRRRR